MRSMKSRVALALCLAWECTLAAAQGANAGSTVTVNIDRQPMEAALNTFATQTGLQLLFHVEEIITPGLTAQRVVGTLPPEQALQQLLRDSGLSFEFINSRTVSIRATQDVQRKPTADASKSTTSKMQLAQSGPPARSAAGDDSSQPEQAAGGPDRDIEEIIVTAQKRAERLIDVPISIVAMSSDQLRKRKISGIDDLAAAVPGLAIESSGGGRRQITLRGVGNVFGSSSLIGVYLDEASVTSMPSTQLDLRTYDLERVEVLRGPQGTLYGEGSAGGTIRFITRDPVLDRFEMKADVAGLFTEDGAPGQRIESAVNVPVVHGKFGLRIASTFEHGGGWIDQPAADRDDFNGQDLINVRVKGLWQPLPQFKINAMALVHRNDTALSIGEDDDGNFLQTFNFTTTPRTKDDYGVYNLTGTYDFSTVRVLSATSYLEQDKESRNFAQRGPYAGPPPASPLEANWLFNGSSAAILTEEFRLSSLGSGRWNWTAGGFYRRAQLNVDTSVLYFAAPVPPGVTPPGPINFVPSDTLSKSWAVFGDTSYDLTDRLTLGAGLRYFEDEQRYISGSGAGAITQNGTFDALNPRVYLQYKLTGHANTYASAAKGFRSGGFNTLTQPTYDPEDVWSFELGLKMALLDGRLTSDAAVFYTDYTNYQILGFRLLGGVPTNLTSNAGDAKIKGIEWALSWHPVDDWTLGLSGNYVKSELVRIDATSTSHIVGDPLDAFPKYGYTATAQRDFNWSGRPGFARLDYNEQGRMTYRNRSIGPWFFGESDIVSLLNFNLGLQWSANLSLNVFAQNLLNERGFITALHVEELASRPRPRTYGIGFGVSFE